MRDMSILILVTLLALASMLVLVLLAVFSDGGIDVASLAW